MIKLSNISKNFGNIKVCEDLTVEFPEGKITAIIGPSGCGKSTLLNVLSGLITPDRGMVIAPEQVSYLFQEPRLLPWLTIWDNVALVLKDKMSVAEIKNKVRQCLKAIGIFEQAHFYPGQLSGGQRQRVAIARAFSYETVLLLMDEPFKSLDMKNRYQLISVLLDLWRRQPRTIITVTHDPKEALMLGDKILVLSDKPLRVIREIEVNVDRDKRMETEEVIRIEKEIIALILK